MTIGRKTFKMGKVEVPVNFATIFGFERIIFMKKQTTLPSSASVFGTTHFPAIDNQGGIGSCASQAITRNQFTNAFSRYLHSRESGSAWCPRDNSDHCFAPKFTYNLSGAGTAWVYDILKEQGCLRLDECSFMKNEQGGSVIKDKDGKLYPQTSSFPVSDGQMERALQYRITNYKQVWFTKEPYLERLTTCAQGKELMISIKEAIVRGDAVVTGGYPARWVFGKLDGCGTLGAVGESAVVAAAGNGGGGHQVTLVGYDDDVTATFAGVQLKGAFLIANSYGSGWQNKGLTWMMYDSVNTVSEYEKLNDTSLYSGPMYLTPAQDMCMFPASLARENQIFTFIEQGSCEIYGKSYPAYLLKDERSGKFLSYKSEKEDRGLTLESDPSGRFSFVPYEEMAEWASSDKQYYKEEYKGSYWIYAVDKTGDEESARMVDAGLGFSSSGRKVGFATHNNGRYPEAKSWNLTGTPVNGLASTLSIAAGKDTVSQRCWTLDQFCFINWEEDVTYGMPTLYAKVTVKATDRECFKILLTRKEKNSTVSKKYTPAMFRYSEFHPKYCDRKKGEYVNFDGVLNGGESTGYFAFSYLPLLKLPKGKSVDDYEWGIELKKGRKGKAALLEATLCNEKRETLSVGEISKNRAAFKALKN